MFTYRKQEESWLKECNSEFEAVGQSIDYSPNSGWADLVGTVFERLKDKAQGDPMKLAVLHSLYCRRMFTFSAMIPGPSFDSIKDWFDKLESGGFLDTQTRNSATLRFVKVCFSEGKTDLGKRYASRLLGDCIESIAEATDHMHQMHELLGFSDQSAE